MTLRFGLKESVTPRINAVFARYSQVDKAILHGSRAKGNFKNGSDIDRTLYGSDLTLNVIYRILDDLD